MVLIVVPHIEGHEVEPSVVTVRLLAGHEDVVLRDEVASDWVQAHAQEGGDYVEHRCPPVDKVPQRQVEGDGGDEVHGLLPARRLGVDDERADGVEDRLQQHPQHLLGGGVEEPAFEVGRHVDVDDVHALRVVVLQVVTLEGDGRRQPLRAVGQHAEQLVVQRLLEAQVVTQLVVAQRHPMRQQAAEAVRQQHELPRLGMQRRGGVDGHGDLGGHQAQDHRQDADVRSVQLLDLRVLLQDLRPPRFVRLVGADAVEFGS
mmetsp:Transcript_1975/g.4878  ORF Transcript_1975/g.4878 Transcript_1975/m.4878 type:complete len:259 (+) Transcript_1975:474-1250(+)